MRTARSIAMGCLSLLAAGTAHAQAAPGRASLVAGAGVAFPLDDFTYMARTGWQASLRGEYRLDGPVAAYLGVRYATFPRKAAEATDGLSMVAPEAGLVLRPRPWSVLTPFVRAGALLPRFESAGEHSGAGMGFTGAVGVESALGPRTTVSVVGEGLLSGSGLRAGPFGPVPPKPGWLGLSLEGRYALP